MTAQEVNGQLRLERCPEGGWYRETWRAPAERPGDRSPGTAILFLLESGARSHWHRVDAAELWIWQGGGPVLLSTAASAASDAATHRLGSDLLAGDKPQLVVTPGEWQAAYAPQGWALVSCVVVPGFEFAGFELAPFGWKPSSPPTSS